MGQPPNVKPIKADSGPNTQKSNEGYEAVTRRWMFSDTEAAVAFFLLEHDLLEVKAKMHAHAPT